MKESDLILLLYRLRHPVPIPDPIDIIKGIDLAKVARFKEIETKLNLNIAALEQKKFDALTELLAQ